MLSRSAFASGAALVRPLSTQAGAPLWERGQIEVLKPQYRMGARRLKILREHAERAGYTVVTRQKERPESYKWEEKEPKGHKRQQKQQLRLQEQEKALKGQKKKHEQLKAKLRKERHKERAKGVKMLYPEREPGPPPRKGLTRYKKRRALGNY